MNRVYAILRFLDKATQYLDFHLHLSLVSHCVVWQIVQHSLSKFVYLQKNPTVNKIYAILRLLDKQYNKFLFTSFTGFILCCLANSSTLLLKVYLSSKEPDNEHDLCSTEVLGQSNIHHPGFYLESLTGLLSLISCAVWLKNKFFLTLIYLHYHLKNRFCTSVKSLLKSIQYPSLFILYLLLI